jgi:hypothetical protein
VSRNTKWAAKSVCRADTRSRMAKKGQWMLGFLGIGNLGIASWAVDLPS